MKRAIVYDVTHLKTKLANRAPTGIDRVDLAFARHVASLASDDVLAAHYGRRTPRIEARGSIERLVGKADRRWNRPPDADRLEAVHAWLNGREYPARRRSRALETFALAVNHGVLPAVRRTTLRGSSFERIPAGAIYLNIAQYAAQHGDFFRWLQERSDVRAAFFIHDLIPLDFPEFWAPGYRAMFSRRVETIFTRAHALLVASECVRQRVLCEMARRGVDPAPILACPLPTTLDQADSQGADPQEGTPGSEVPYFVMLGTIEPRKNHQLILNVWRRLAATRTVPPKLLILGRRGWRNTHVVDMIERAPGLRSHVLEIADLSGRAVERLLASARALLMPSFAEGFGLPVVEALRVGTPVVASDIPVFREVARGHAIYRDPIDAIGWSAAIEALCDDGSPLLREARASARDFPVRRPHDYFADIEAFLRTL